MEIVRLCGSWRIDQAPIVAIGYPLTRDGSRLPNCTSILDALDGFHLAAVESAELYPGGSWRLPPETAICGRPTGVRPFPAGRCEPSLVLLRLTPHATFPERKSEIVSPTCRHGAKTPQEVRLTESWHRAAGHVADPLPDPMNVRVLGTICVFTN
jgi:hypothetical protein